MFSDVALFGILADYVSFLVNLLQIHCKHRFVGKTHNAFSGKQNSSILSIESDTFSKGKLLYLGGHFSFFSETKIGSTFIVAWNCCQVSEIYIAFCFLV